MLLELSAEARRDAVATHALLARRMNESRRICESILDRHSRLDAPRFLRRLIPAKQCEISRYAIVGIREDGERAVLFDDLPLDVAKGLKAELAERSARILLAMQIRRVPGND